MTLAPQIRVKFRGDDNELAHRVIGALLDMTLTGQGATIEELELAAIGVTEVVDAITERGRVTKAELKFYHRNPIFCLQHTAKNMTFENGALELAQAAFPLLVVVDGLVELPYPIRPGDSGA